MNGNINIKHEKLVFDLTTDMINQIMSYLYANQDELGLTSQQINDIQEYLMKMHLYEDSVFEETQYPDGTYQGNSIDSIFLPVQAALDFLEIEYERVIVLKYSYQVENFEHPN